MFVFSCIYNFCFWSACVYLMAKIVYGSPVEIVENDVLENNGDSDAISDNPDCDTYLFVHTSSLTANDTLVLGGYEIEFDMRLGLHICRAKHEGNMLPGKRIPGACYVPFQGQGFGYKDHEVMINPKAANFHWVKSSDFEERKSNYLFPGAVPAGWTKSGDFLYVARCYVQQSDGNTIVIPGYIDPLEFPIRAHVVFGSQTDHVCEEYEVLVCT